MKTRLFPLLIFIFALTLPVFSQENVPEDVIELRSNGCEIDEHNFGRVSYDAKTKMGKNDVLIAIARLGIGDKKTTLNRLRLAATKEWLVGKAGFPTSKLVLAEGEKVRGEGSVEFYIGGRLTHIIFPKTNLALCSECCAG